MAFAVEYGLPMATPIRVLAYDHIKVAIADIPKFVKSLEVLGFIPVDRGPEFLNGPDKIYASGEAVFCIYRHDHPGAKKH